MLTARSVIIFSVVLVCLVMAGVLIELFQPPDSGGKGRDSFGTTASGHRAIFELLEELKVPVDRGLVPPSSLIKEKDATVVFWGPDPQIIAAEPAFLNQMKEWIRNGGKVIVAVGQTPPPLFRGMRPKLGKDDAQLLEQLGLPDVTTMVSLLVTDGNPGQFHNFDVKSDGALSHLNSHVKQLAAPAQVFQEMEIEGKRTPDGSLYHEKNDGTRHTFACVYKVEKGEVLVVSDAALFSNVVIAKKDNAVLAAHLLTSTGKPLVFDEFYHGLTIRGNPAWLMTRRPYGLLMGVMILAALIWAWRESVRLGPSLDEKSISRRSIGEYLDAMAGLFHRGDCRQYTMRELKEGILWTLSRRLGLARGKENVQDVAAVLARKHPESAAKLKKSVEDIDSMLSGKTPATELFAVKAARQITECL
jgi:hypothetical protein